MEDKDLVEKLEENLLPTERNMSNGNHVDCYPSITIKTEPPDAQDHIFLEESPEHSETGLRTEQVGSEPENLVIGMEDKDLVEKLEEILFPTERNMSNGAHVDCYPGITMKAEPPAAQDHFSSEESSEQEMAEMLKLKTELKTEAVDAQFRSCGHDYIVPDNPAELLASSDSRCATALEENGHQHLLNVFDAQPEDSKCLPQLNEEVQTFSPISVHVVDSMLDFEVEDSSQTRSRRKQVFKPIEDLPESGQMSPLSTLKATKTLSPLACKDCGKLFAKRYSFQAHRKVHASIKCAVCRITLKTMNDISDHAFSHNKVPPFQCILCKKPFPSVGALSHHLTSHSGIKSFKCDNCEYGYARSDHLLSHQKTCRIGSEVRRCTNCQKTFASVKYLKIHIEHLVCTQPYECIYCKASFISSKSLSLHARNSH